MFCTNSFHYSISGTNYCRIWRLLSSFIICIFCRFKLQILLRCCFMVWKLRLGSFNKFLFQYKITFWLLLFCFWLFDLVINLFDLFTRFWYSTLFKLHINSISILVCFNSQARLLLFIILSTHWIYALISRILL